MSGRAAIDFRPQGRVSLASLTSLREAGETAIAEAGEHVVIDLSGIENGNSAGVAALIAWFRAAERQGKSIEFRHVPPDLGNIIELSGLTDALPLERGAPAAGAGP